MARRNIRLAVLLVFSLAAPYGAASTFFVDSVTGNDAAAGTTPESAWASLAHINDHAFKPGDRILLHAGQTWTGTIEPHGSGTAELPITLGAYGDGSRPEIHGAGAGAAIVLREISYWTVRDLSVTNHGKDITARNGIFVHVSNAGTVAGIHLVHLKVSDVNGDVGSKSSGGIGFWAWGKQDRPARFRDVLIDQCTIEHVDSEGIWFRNKNGVSSDSPDWDKFHNSEVRITNTAITDTGRTAIFMRSTEAPLIDRNVIRYAAARHHGNAIVLVSNKDAIVRENDIAFTGVDTGDGENGAIDADDSSLNTIVEYNWSHDNAGGAVNVVDQPRPGAHNDNTIVRFNVSENDRARVFGIGGIVTNVYIYNNTIFVGKGTSPRILETGRFVRHTPGLPDHVAFLNNLIYSEGHGSYALEGMHIQLDSNCFAGKHDRQERMDQHAQTDDVSLNPALFPVKRWQEISGYRLPATSACAHSGMAFAGNGGRDILNTPLTQPPDRGALASTAK